MSRDGLLPPIFSRIHPKFKTPSFSTILTGILVGIPALFLNLTVVVDLCSVGTLFAFVLVCGGILRLQQQRKKLIANGGTPLPESKFKTPYINGKWIVPALFLATIILCNTYYPGGVVGFFNRSDAAGWEGIREKVPYIMFGLVFLVMTILSFVNSYSLIPVLGFLCCSYLLCESGTSNWERFLLWLLAGLVVYFLYGRRKSKLANQ
jgi:amino acid transporter